MNLLSARGQLLFACVVGCVVGCGSPTGPESGEGDHANASLPEVQRRPAALTGWTSAALQKPDFPNFGWATLDVHRDRVLVAGESVEVTGPDYAMQHRIHVAEWDGHRAVTLGAPLVPQFDVEPWQLVVRYLPDGTPLVAWAEPNLGLRVYAWRNEEWTSVTGPWSGPAALCPSFAGDGKRLVLSWKSGAYPGDGIHVAEYGAASRSWKEIAPPIAPEETNEFWSCPSVAVAGTETFVSWDENSDDGNASVTTRSRVYVARLGHGRHWLLGPPVGVEGPAPGGDYCRLNWYPKLTVTSPSDVSVAWKSCDGIHSVRYTGSNASPIELVTGNASNPFPLIMLTDDAGRPTLIARTDEAIPKAFALRREANGSWARLDIGTPAGFYGVSAQQVAKLDSTGALIILGGPGGLARMKLQ